jgi:hypothetical protein
MEVMKALVSMQCDFVNHSSPGGPPFRETGAGQDSIDWEPMNYGARIGVGAMPGISKMLENNYMAGWDHEDGIRGDQRPWLSLWIEYKEDVDKIFDRAIKLKLAA